MELTKEYFDKQFKTLDKRFEKIDQRFDGIDQRFDGIDQRFEVVNKRFEKIDQRFEKIDKQFVAMKSFVKEEVEGLARMIVHTCATKEDIKVFTSHLHQAELQPAVTVAELTHVNIQYQVLEKRVTQLEQRASA